MTAVLGLSCIHGLLAKWRKDFVNGTDKHSEKFYRIINEVPTILMLVAIIMEAIFLNNSEFVIYYPNHLITKDNKTCL